MKTVGDGTKGQYRRRAIARKRFDIATWNSVRLLRPAMLYAVAVHIDSSMMA